MILPWDLHYLIPNGIMTGIGDFICISRLSCDALYTRSYLAGGRSSTVHLKHSRVCVVSSTSLYLFKSARVVLGTEHPKRIRLPVDSNSPQTNSILNGQNPVYLKWSKLNNF